MAKILEIGGYIDVCTTGKMATAQQANNEMEY